MGRPLESFANASLNIFWPKENSVGKWVLYLTQVSSKGVQSVPCLPANEVNPLKDVKVILPFSFRIKTQALLVTNTSNLKIFGIKGWHDRKRREAEYEAFSTDGFPFLPTTRKHKTLVNYYYLSLNIFLCVNLGRQMSYERPVILPFRPAQMD